jgi:hypothetical protein
MVRAMHLALELDVINFNKVPVSSLNVSTPFFLGVIQSLET